MFAQYKLRNSLIAFFLFTSLVVLAQQLVAANDSGDSGSRTGSDASTGSSQFVAGPKRQYLIAPRVGRSGSQPVIWSALEEASFASPGQIQPHRGYPGPLRSSLMFLVGNRRIIGPRSGGLLPQARIGRRASPIGLMPQPRVGRRSSSPPEAPENSLYDNLDMDESFLSAQQEGQQEVAVATLSDTSSFNDALESFVNGS